MNLEKLSLTELIQLLRDPNATADVRARAREILLNELFGGPWRT